LFIGRGLNLLNYFLLPMNGKKIVLAALVILVVLVGGLAYYYRQQYWEIRNNPQKLIQDEVSAVVEQVRQIMVLPEGEVPTLATVTDPSKLKDQPFFARAKVGDKVLLYTNARRAILFDPVNNKIVEVAPISIGNPPGVTTPPPAPEPAAAPSPKP
jgi:hypothetical protein